MLIVSSEGINQRMKITSLWEFIKARYHLTAFIGTNKIVMSVCIPVWRLMVFLPNFVGILVWCFDRSVCLTIRGFKVPTVYLSSKLSVCIRVSYDQSKGCSAGLFYDYLAVCLSVCICKSTIISLKIVLLVFEWLSAWCYVWSDFPTFPLLVCLFVYASLS